MINRISFILLTLCFSLSQAATISIGNGCSLNDAIKSANLDTAVGSCTAGSGTDILVTPDVWFLNLTGTLPTIKTDMTITTQTVAGNIVISGQDQYRIFEVSGASTDLILTRVELVYGFRPNLAFNGGAAILINDATVTINDSRIAHHTVTGVRGGAININNGELYINNTVLEYNETISAGPTAITLDGGAIFAQNSDVEITDSTFQNNQVGSNVAKGASLFMDVGTLALESSLMGDTLISLAGEAVIADVINTTFSNDTPSNADDPIYFSENSAVSLNHITVLGRIIFQGSILSVSNSRIEDCVIADSTWLVDSQNSFGTNNCNGNAGMLENLLPLNDNGGPTRTRALSIISPLINAGDDNYCTAEDQRGEARNGLCDIGAYESNGYADVSVSRVFSQNAPYASNQSITYTAKIKNFGPGVATAVAVHLDTDNVFIESINSPICSSFPCVINNIQNQQEIIIPVTMTVGNHNLNQIEINLEASTSGNSNHEDLDEDLPFPQTNNIENDTYAVVAGADMHIDMQLINEPPYFVGQTVSYQATLKNLGQQQATGITFDFLPTNLNVTGFTGCSSVNGLSCSTLSLLNGESRDVTVNAMITDNQFDATGFVTSELLDIDLTNNSDDQQNGGGVNEVDISVTMTLVQNPPIYSDQFIQFEIRLKGGEEDASNVKIWSEFPGALINSHSGCSQIPCTIPLLEAEAEIILYFDYFAPIANITAGNTYSHRLFIMPGQQDPNLSNNEVILEGSLNAAANLAVFADLVTQPPYYQNQEVEYQLRVINAGINTATNVLINAGDPNLELLWAQGGQCATVICQLAQLLRTQEEYMTLVFRIREPGEFSLKATVIGNEIDLDPINNISIINATAIELLDDLIFKDSFD